MNMPDLTRIKPIHWALIPLPGKSVDLEIYFDQGYFEV